MASSGGATSQAATTGRPIELYSQEEKQFLRISTLILKTGTRALRCFFDSKINPGMLQHELNIPNNKHKLNTLKSRKVIRPGQWDTLYPPSGAVISSTNFDITLMCLLLREIGGLTAPTTGWDRMPGGSDHSEAADIVRLRMYRNEMAHNSDGVISNVEFQTKSNDIQQAITRLAHCGGQNFSSEMNRILTCAIDERDEELWIEVLQIKKDIDELKRKEKRRSSEDDGGKNSKNTKPEISSDISEMLLKSWKEDDETFCPTKATEYIYREVMNKQKVILSGLTGVGKSANARHIALRLKDEGYRLFCVNSVKEMVELIDISGEEKQVYVFDDVFGVHGVVEENLKEWSDENKDDLERCLKKPNVIILCTSRLSVINDDKMSSIKSRFTIINMSQGENELSDNERLEIFRKHATAKQRNDLLKDGNQLKDDVTRMIEKLKSPLGFPLACRLYTGDKETKLAIEEYFGKPDLFKTGETEVHLPPEILKMDQSAVNMFLSLLKDGKIRHYDMRIMVVGAHGVGKSSLTKRLLKLDFDMKHQESTEGIEIYETITNIVDEHWETEKEAVQSITSPTHKIAKMLLTKSEEKETPNATVDNTSETMSDHISNKTDDIVDGGQNADPPSCLEGERNISANQKDVAYPEYGESNKDFENLETVIKHAKNPRIKKDYGEVRIWDFGGQEIFYSTHQLHFTARAIYIVVLDMRHESLSEVAKDTVYVDIRGGSGWTHNDFLVFWLNSIYTYGQKAPVIIVATHADQYKGSDQEKYKKMIQETIDKNCPYANQMVERVICLDNSHVETESQEDNYKRLRLSITRRTKKRKFWGETVPIAYFQLEEQLNKKKQPIVTYVDIMEENSNLSNKLSETDLKLCLRFHHAVGKCIYFDEPAISDYVVLDTKWLINACKCFITNEDFLQDRVSVGCINAWKKCLVNGFLTEEVLNELWECGSESFEEKEPFQNYSKEIIMFLKRLDIIVQVPNNKNVNNFFVPSMLKQKVNNSTFEDLNNNFTSTAILCFGIVEFVPAALFHRVLAACMRKWEVSEDNGKKQIYCGCAVFNLDKTNNYKLLLTFVNHKIQLQVFGRSPISMNSYCIQTRDFVTDKIEGFLRLYDLEADIRQTMCVKCQNSTLDANEGLLKTEMLLECMMQKEATYYCDKHVKKHRHDPYPLLEHWFSDHDKVRKRKKNKNNHTDLSGSGAMEIDKKILYANLLAELSEHISSDIGNLGKFKQKLSAKLTRADLARNKNTIDVLQAMESRGCLAIGDYTYLKSVLAGDHEDLVKMVEETERKMRGDDATVKHEEKDESESDSTTITEVEERNVDFSYCSSSIQAISPPTTRKRRRGSENDGGSGGCLDYVKGQGPDINSEISSASSSKDSSDDNKISKKKQKYVQKRKYRAPCGRVERESISYDRQVDERGRRKKKQRETDMNRRQNPYDISDKEDIDRTMNTDLWKKGKTDKISAKRNYSGNDRSSDDSEKDKSRYRKLHYAMGDRKRKSRPKSRSVSPERKKTRQHESSSKNIKGKRIRRRQNSNESYKKVPGSQRTWTGDYSPSESRKCDVRKDNVRERSRDGSYERTVNSKRRRGDSYDRCDRHTYSNRQDRNNSRSTRKHESSSKNIKRKCIRRHQSSNESYTCKKASVSQRTWTGDYSPSESRKRDARKDNVRERSRDGSYERTVNNKRRRSDSYDRCDRNSYSNSQERNNSRSYSNDQSDYMSYRERYYANPNYHDDRGESSRHRSYGDQNRRRR